MAINPDDYDKTLVLAGPKPKRVRYRVVNTALEQTTWTAKGPKVTTKSLGDATNAIREFEKAVRKKLRDDYVVLGESGILLEAFAPGGGGGAVLDLSPDGMKIVTATITSESSFGAKVEVVDVATGAREVVVEMGGGVTQNFLHAALFDREAKSILYALRDDTWRVDLATRERNVVVYGQDAALNPHVLRPSWNAARKRLVVFATGPFVRVLDEKLTTILEVSTKSPTTECRAAALSPSGRLLAIYIVSRGIVYGDDRVADTTNEVQIWDVEARVKWETVEVREKLHKIGLSFDDAALIVTHDYAQGPIALEIPSGRELWRLSDGDRLARTHAWAYSPDGARLAIAGDQLHVLDAKTRKPALELPPIFGRVGCPMFSRDGKRLAASIAGTAFVFAV